MKYRNLMEYVLHIQKCNYWSQKNPPCVRSLVFPPVINKILPTQKYLIISSDPSSGTDKQKTNVPASDFACRFLALLFLGDDTSELTEKVLRHFYILKDIFDRNFYWTHYCKCHAFGNPNSFCALTYLYREIELSQPADLIISLGSKPVDFLLGKGSLKDRVCKILDYRGIPLIASLHPSRDWNINRRDEYQFYETWNLIRPRIELSSKDRQALADLEINFPEHGYQHLV